MPRAGLDPDRVVRAAAELADELGHDRLTLAAVAARFDVAVPSLYKHVEGIDDVHRRLTVLAIEELGHRLAVAASEADGVGASGAGRRERLRAVARAHRGYARTHPALHAATVRAAGPDDTALRAASDDVLATVLAVLEDYGASGDDAVDAARTVRSALHGFSTLEAAGGFGLPRDVDRSFDALVDTLHDGLVAQYGSRTDRPDG